jgi:CBS-domain-containing membrane protein
MSSPSIQTKLQCVLQMLTKHKVKSPPVIDQRRNLVGIIARESKATVSLLSCSANET